MHGLHKAPLPTLGAPFEAVLVHALLTVTAQLLAVAALHQLLAALHQLLAVLHQRLRHGAAALQLMTRRMHRPGCVAAAGTAAPRRSSPSARPCIINCSSINSSDTMKQWTTQTSLPACRRWMTSLMACPRPACSLQHPQHPQHHRWDRPQRQHQQLRQRRLKLQRQGQRTVIQALGLQRRSEGAASRVARAETSRAATRHGHRSIATR